VALREAQRRLLADPVHRSPAAWGGFAALGGVLATEN
jgi:CHAT domain-containing protein